MLTHIHGAKCIGIDAVDVTVEVDIDKGIGIHLVGLADIAVKESLLRTITALESVGYRIPGKKIVINLAPADLRKNGSGYDLPIAIGIIAASGQESLPALGEFIIMGELGLDGSVRAVNGALPIAELAQKKGLTGVILPAVSAGEAAEFTQIGVYGVSSLPEVIEVLKQEHDCSHLLVHSDLEDRSKDDEDEFVDFADIIGQECAKRGMEIAAGGGHNIAMIGAPGSGKTSIAKALAGILPPMSLKESMTTSKIYSVAGKGSHRAGLIRRRPFRAPHYSASLAAIIGGGNGDNILPGEVSLADGGVLFLDEFAQMPRSVIEALRCPIEDRKVTISRLKSKVEFPASFMLVAASNPCPCGYYGEGDRCTCTPSQRLNYLGKLSGPIMDRIDLQVWMHQVPSDQIIGARKGESSEVIAQRVATAREIQAKRFKDEKISTNAEMNGRQIKQYVPLSDACQQTLERIMSREQLSMRAYYRIIKTARTIADLAALPYILPEHIIEAASFRLLDKQGI